MSSEAAAEQQLPSCIALRSKSNGKFLRYVHGHGEEKYRQLELSGEDALSLFTRFDVEPSRLHDGLVHIRCRYNRKYWVARRHDDDGWIAGSSNDDDLFELLQVGDDSFALRSTRTIFTPGGGPMAFSDNFCINQTSPAAALMNALEAASSTLPREALVKVEAAVMHREISDMVYFLDEARVYDRMPVTMAMADAVNDTSAPTTKRLTISFEETETTQWDATLELTLGYTATMKVGFPKLGLGAQAELSAEFFGSYNWGETVVTTVKKAVEYEVTVPPRTKVSVRVMATKATCDVPFGYIQKDTFTDGRVETRRKQDGIFTGVNSYNFQFHATEMPLEQRLIMQQHAS